MKWGMGKCKSGADMSWVIDVETCAKYCMSLFFLFYGSGDGVLLDEYS